MPLAFKNFVVPFMAHNVAFCRIYHSSLKQQITMADEKFRHLQLQKDKADEENTKLTLENRKMGGAVGKEERENKENQSSDGWARQLQNDRDVADLKEKVSLMSNA